MDIEIREKIKRLEQEIADLKKEHGKTRIKPLLKSDIIDIYPIGCLHHIARAKDGKRVYCVNRRGNNEPVYTLAKKLFKFNKIEELSHDEAKEVADFCNEIIPIFNKFAIQKYVVDFDRQRFDEAYQDIFDYLQKTGKGAEALKVWKEDRDVTLKRIMKMRGEDDG